MVSIFVRDAFVGRLIYLLSNKRFLKHPEDKKDYVVPAKYLENAESQGSLKSKEVDEESAAEFSGDAEEPSKATPSKEDETEKSTSDNRIMVTWDSDDDPQNPYNWPLYQKVLLILEVGLLTVSIYIGSSIYTPGFDKIMEEFGVSQVVAILPLSLFVVGYGLGPLIFSPLSEHPAIGRTAIYTPTLIVFVVLQIPTALSKNIGSMLVLRFLAGFFASPALSTGGASVGDIIGLPRMPLGLATWAISGVCGPVGGPLIGGVFVQLVSWRWTFWFLLILSGSTCLVLSFFLPETSQKCLLYRKAQRLRAITGNENILSDGDLMISSMTLRDTAIDTLYRPFKIALSEPMVFFVNCYIALVYAIFYTFFEAFPVVLVGIHHFNPIEQGVSYIAVMIGVVIGCSVYCTFIYRQFTVPMESGTMVAPEVFIPAAIVGAAILPVGLFIFAWSSTASAHWIGPLLGALIFSIGGFIIFQTLFNYLAFSFHRYMASVFASNNLFRAGFACSFPLFANAMYSHMGPDNYPVGWGCSLLAFVACAMILIPIVFYKYGVKLRGRSQYAN